MLRKKQIVIDWADDNPVVVLPAGTALSGKFKLETSRTVTIRKLLAAGDSNAKLAKSNKAQDVYKTFGLTLAPAGLADIGNMCGNNSIACTDYCLDGSGMRAVYENIHLSKIARTWLFRYYRSWFINQLARELDNKQTHAKRNNYIAAIRLNVMSDWPFETTGIIDQFPAIQFYDYSKHLKRAGLLRPNYWVTFSRSESNQRATMAALISGHNVAVVFADSNGGPRRPLALPESYKGYDVINGDLTDLRFLDRRGVVVGLKLKTHTIAQYQAACATGFPVLVN